MTDGVSQEQFYAALQNLELRLLSRIDDRANRLEGALAEHADDDRMVANRVLVIETQRYEEKALAVKRGVWSGIAAASGMTAFIEIVRHYWK